MKLSLAALYAISGLSWIYAGANIFVVLWPLDGSLAVTGAFACLAMSGYMVYHAIKAGKS